jgi:hypothetical protein
MYIISRRTVLAFITCKRECIDHAGADSAAVATTVLMRVSRTAPAPLHRSHSVNFVLKHSMQQMCSPFRIVKMLLSILSTMQQYKHLGLHDSACCYAHRHTPLLLYKHTDHSGSAAQLDWNVMPVTSSYSYTVYRECILPTYGCKPCR